MDSITLFVLALGLSMDAFAVSISNSMCFSGLRRNEAALTSLSFGVFQGLMPVAGYFAGRAFADVVSAFDHWIAFALLGFIGGKMIWDAVKELRAPEACPVGRAFSYKLMVVQAFSPRAMLPLAVATSIDALAVGVSFAALDVNIAAAASFIACVTFVCCLAGHLLGKKFGSWLGGKAEIFGGVILVCIGAKILVEHLSGG